MTVTFTVAPNVTGISDYKDDIVCLFTAEKGWFQVEKEAGKENLKFKAKENKNKLELEITLDGAVRVQVREIAPSPAGDEDLRSGPARVVQHQY